VFVVILFLFLFLVLVIDTFEEEEEKEDEGDRKTVRPRLSASEFGAGHRRESGLKLEVNYGHASLL
jgi:hypothetical protein